MMSPEVEFAGRLGVLAEVFGEVLTPIRVGGYWAALQDQVPTDVWAALDHALKTSKFFPRPAELREHAEALAEKRRKYDADHNQIEPVYRRLAADNPPASPERIAAFWAEMRALVKSMPQPDRRMHGRKR
jgi:hypothetical protein